MDQEKVDTIRERRRGDERRKQGTQGDRDDTQEKQDTGSKGSEQDREKYETQ